MDLHAAFPSTFGWRAVFCGPRHSSCSERHVRCGRRSPTEEGCLALKMKHKGCLMWWDQAATATNMLCAKVQCRTTAGKQRSWFLGHVPGWMTQLSRRRKNVDIFSALLRGVASTSHRNTIRCFCHLLSTPTPAGWQSIPPLLKGIQRFV